MEQFITLIKRIIKEGREKKDRTGTGTISLFGHQSTYNLSEGFPLFTAKSTYTKGVIVELLWFLGNHMKNEEYKNLPMTNIKFLKDNNVSIWDEWADKDGNLGPVYGQQWRKWKVYSPAPAIQASLYGKDSLIIDQIKTAIERLKTNPEDRGIIVSAWNVGELGQMALRPCHTMFQFYAEELTLEERNNFYTSNYLGWDENSHEALDKLGNIPKYKLSLQLYQRSADTFLGVPFNIASYSLLLHMVAQVTNMIPGNFVHTFGDAHIYSNHKSQVNELLKRISPELKETDGLDFWSDKSLLEKVGNDWPALPTLWLNPEIKNIEDFTLSDIRIDGYKPLSKINAPIAV